jgi:HEAT repeat protein
MRIMALSKLENDPDSRINKGLLKAAADKHWAVRVAALSAIARHSDVTLIGPITAHMADNKADVRYTAAAAVLRLSALLPADEVVHSGSEVPVSEIQVGQRILLSKEEIPPIATTCSEEIFTLRTARLCLITSISSITGSST